MDYVKGFWMKCVSPRKGTISYKKELCVKRENTFLKNLDKKELQTYGNMPFRSTISYKEELHFLEKKTLKQ
jgi:hypothetical protein